MHFVFFVLGGLSALGLSRLLANNMTPMGGWIRKKIPQNLELSEVYSIDPQGKFYNVTSSLSIPEMSLAPQSIAYLNDDNLTPELVTSVSRVVVSDEKYFYILDLEGGVIYGPGHLAY